MTPSVSSERNATKQILRASATLAVPGTAPALLWGSRLPMAAVGSRGALVLGILASRRLWSTCTAGWQHPETCRCGPRGWRGVIKAATRNLHSGLPAVSLSGQNVKLGQRGAENCNGSKTHPPLNCHLCHVLPTRRDWLERVTGTGGEGNKKAQGAQRQREIMAGVELKTTHTGKTTKNENEKMKTILPYLCIINMVYTMPRAVMYSLSPDFRHSGKRTNRGFFSSQNYLYHMLV